MTCRIDSIRQDPRAVDLRRFETLHHDGRALVKGWRERAASSRQGDAFEAFIYLWIAFNSWAACVTGSDGDREWQDKLVADPTLNDLFDRQVSGQGRTADAVRRFSQLWPIFRVSKLRERGIDYWSGRHASRDEMIRA